MRENNPDINSQDPEIKIGIRVQQPADDEAVHAAVSAAFGRENEAMLVEGLRKTDKTAQALALVAEVKGKIVGQIQFSSIQIVDGDSSLPALSLAPLAVHPEFQNQGIGSALTRYGLELAREMGHHIVLVLGHPDYYPRFGFSAEAARSITCPFGDVGDAWMALALKPGALQDVKGRAVYPPIFLEV